MARLEAFKPKLKYGRIIPQGEKLLFETEKPVDQIVLPIEVADFLLLCNGEHSVGEIIEKIYHNRGTIQFKAIYKTLIYLKERGFLENGSELETDQISDKNPEQQFIAFQPLAELPIGKRIFNEKARPKLFYFTAMLVLLTAILSLQRVDSTWLDFRFLSIENSYARGLLFLFLATSVLLSIKSFYKCLLLIFLTGRAYNFSLVFNGFSLYFRVKSDSLFLVNNKLFLALFYFSVTLCYFPIVLAADFFFPNWPHANEALGIAFLLFLLELNPFQDSESNYFIKTLFNDDTLSKTSSYFKNKSLLSILQPFDQHRAKATYMVYANFALIWAVVTFYSSLSAFSHHHSHIVASIKSGGVLESLAAILALSFIVALACVVTYNAVKLFYHSVASLVTQALREFIKSKRSKKLNYLDNKEVLSVLETLPLFNYFSPELLGMIIDRSEVRVHAQGASVVAQGDEAQHLFVLLKGFLKVTKQDESGETKEIGEIHPPSIFGEIAVVEDTRRAASVVASQDSIVLHVPAGMLRQIAQNSQYIRELDGFRNAIMVNQFFCSAPFFRDLNEEIIHLFTVKGKIETFLPDQIVFKQGDMGDGFYLILRGSVGVSVNEHQISCIQQGGFFGETSMIVDIPRTATIYAIDHVTTLKIGRDAFWEILSRDINMAMFIETVGELRIREDIEILKSGSAKVA